MLAHFGTTYRKVINMLRAARRLGRKGELFLIAQQVNRRRLACVRAAGKSNLRHFEVWQIGQMIDRREKSGLPEEGHRGEGRAG